MWQFQVLLWAVFPLWAVAINPFKSPFQKYISLPDNSPISRSSEGSGSSVKVSQTAKPVGNFNFKELLVSKAQKPEFYAKAMLELKRLEDEPLCHRLAAQLLMNTCRNLQDITEQTLEFTTARLQRNHVESFAAALTLCDMEDVGWEVPEQCYALSSTAMQQVVENNEDTLLVPPNQVQVCLTTLSQDHTHWMTWLHRRDSALLFCRAASIDMDKDQLFESQKKLVQIMAEFANNLGDELEHLKMSMKAHTHEADEYFEGFMKHAHRLKSKFQDTMETASREADGIVTSIAFIRQSGIDIERALHSLFQTTVEVNAEMAANQEQSLAVTTTKLENQLETINKMAVVAKAYTDLVEAAMQNLSSRAETLARQQEAMGERSQSLAMALGNATDLFEIHANQLEQASLTVSKIHSSLGNIVSITDFVSKFSKGLNFGGSFGDWAIRVIVPPSSILFGSYGLPPSLTRNALLFLGGEGVSEIIIYLRHYGSWDWAPESFIPSAFTHLARKHPTPTPTPSENPVEDQPNSMAGSTTENDIA
ncbi:Uncharacterized protein BP5553_04607 [Venustampulla echinocandica]|uniref:Nuclear fusion protein KAR5 n=1 Tax=Venustampulla echinocandica TaxID=2656787 RepID=A0A370TNT3_9HELO|nr:Uncharacterized protein BP5553_04607 [Venustampulla echinocandica]RDL37174.1 Uncharacterized protein BP5553_04607 [Venustampulla echinocandica]